MKIEIKVPLTITLTAGEIVVAVIEDDAELWNFVLRHCVLKDVAAPASLSREGGEDE